MTAAVDYVAWIDKKIRFSTSKTAYNHIYISRNEFLDLIENAYDSGYIQCIKDMNNENDKYKNFYNGSTQQGGYNMDIKVILDRIDNLDNKYDKKLDNINDEIHLIDKKVDITETKLDSINETLEAMQREQKDKKKFWIGAILAPIITSIISGIIVGVTVANILSSLSQQ